MAKRRRYTDKERATLIVMLESEGYPDKLGALQKVADYSTVPPATLHRWFHEKNNPAPSELVNKKRIDLKKAIAEELSAIFVQMDTARKEADYRALGTVAGILFDKQQLLENKPTERIAHEHSGQLTIDERRQRIQQALDNPSLRGLVGLPATDD